MTEVRDISALTRDEKEVLQRRVGMAISTGLSREDVALRLNLDPLDITKLLKSKPAQAALALARSASEHIVAAENAVTAQDFVEDARRNLDIVRGIRDTAFPTTPEAQDAATIMGIPTNPSLAKSIAFELLGIAGHSKVSKTESVQRLEINSADAALLREALTEARSNRAPQIISVPVKYLPLDTHE